MKKFGFTLVEVLMTLGIIGVVGMLVTPSLMQNGRNETNAARLSTAVSNFENALATGMAADGAEDLYHWDVWTDSPAQNPTAAQLNAFYGDLTRFMVLNGHDDSGDILGVAPRNIVANGAAGADADFGDDDFDIYTALRAKNGALIYIVNKANQAVAGEADEDTARAAGRTLYNKAADIIIDVNGEAGPNIVGRDIFAFMLSHEGVLYPYGSQEVHAYNPNIPLWNGSCLGNNESLVASETCTARVVENGYRIDY